jgi:hypothetical protein
MEAQQLAIMPVARVELRALSVASVAPELQVLVPEARL